MRGFTLSHLPAEKRREYYEEEMTFPKFSARISLTPGRLDDDVGTFVMSVCLFSNSENRDLTDEERFEIIDTTIEKLQEWKDDIKKRRLITELSGLEDK